VTLAETGRLLLESSVSHVLPLDAVDDALRMLRDKSEPVRRIVIVP